MGSGRTVNVGYSFIGKVSDEQKGENVDLSMELFQMVSRVNRGIFSCSVDLESWSVWKKALAEMLETLSVVEGTKQKKSDQSVFSLGREMMAERRVGMEFAEGKVHSR